MSKYNAKKVEYKGIVFDSKVECDYYQYLERNLGDEYDHIELQPRYESVSYTHLTLPTIYSV